MAEFDARPLNWRFVVPGEPRGLLLLPVGEERLPGADTPEPSASGVTRALRGGPYRAVAVVDVGQWAGLAGMNPGAFLGRFAATVEPGGWLYAGFANPLYPGRPASVGSLGLQRARRVLREAGMPSPRVYLPLPDHRCPAYLVSAGGLEFDHFLRHLFHPHVGGVQGRWGQARLAAQALARTVVLPAPQVLRLRLVPAHALVAVSRE